MMRRFLANRRGDTLIEALAALLIAALGAALLATMVMASVSTAASSKQALGKVYAAESNLVKMESAGTLTIVAGEGGVTVADSTAVTVYESADGTFSRYELPDSGGSAA